MKQYSRHAGEWCRVGRGVVTRLDALSAEKAGQRGEAWEKKEEKKRERRKKEEREGESFVMGVEEGAQKEKE